MRRYLQSLIVLVWSLMLLWSGSAHSQPPYVVMDLGVNVWPNAISPMGMLCGSALVNHLQQAFRQPLTGTLQVLPGFPGGQNSLAWDCLDDGTATGEAINAFPPAAQHGVVWDTTGAMHDLGLLKTPDAVTSVATCFDGSGGEAGYASVTDTTVPSGLRVMAAVFANGQVMPLPGIGGAYDTILACTNGLAAGDLSTPDGFTHAGFWDANGQPHDLGTLGGYWSFGNTADRFGTVYGASDDAKGIYHAAAFTVNHGAMALADPPGYWGCEAYAVNNRHVVVGNCVQQGNTFPPVEHAFLWRAHSPPVDLNSVINPTSGWVLEEATAINDAGLITVVGQYQGTRHGGVLVPPALAHLVPQSSAAVATTELTTPLPPLPTWPGRGRAARWLLPW